MNYTGPRFANQGPTIRTLLFIFRLQENASDAFPILTERPHANAEEGWPDPHRHLYHAPRGSFIPVTPILPSCSDTVSDN